MASNRTNLRSKKNMKSGNEKPKKNDIGSHLENFRQQQPDYAWLTAPYRNTAGSDHFHKSVICSNFPASLNEDDFEYYISMTFSDFPEYIRIKMKDLFNKNDLKSSLGDLIIDNYSDGTQTAILIQILTEKNEREELKMVVGFVSVTQKPSMDYNRVEGNWQNERDKLQRALQYIFGNEAHKELDHK